MIVTGKFKVEYRFRYLGERCEVSLACRVSFRYLEEQCEVSLTCRVSFSIPGRAM